MERFRVGMAALAAALTVLNQPAASQGGGAAATLTPDDVTALMMTAARALADEGLAVAIVDRPGTILGVYSRPNAAPASADVAVSLARTAAFFTNDQAPLSSRTVRYISGIHFPPGIPNTGNAALYGIENTNRGCQVDDLGDAIFNLPIDRPKGLRGTFSTMAGVPPLPCRPSDTSGCAAGGPILGPGGVALSSVGITTGKRNLRDRDPDGSFEEGINAGGFPIVRGNQVIGGIGVAGVPPDRAEYAAALAAQTAGRGLGLQPPIPTPGAVFIDGIRLPLFGACISFDCIVDALTNQRPPGSSTGAFVPGHVRVPTPFQSLAAKQAPEGYLIGPRASAVAGGLTVEDVQRLVQQSVDAASRTRAVIRLPFGQTTRMIISVADSEGEILAAFRMPDATIFSLDVAMTKARNAYYFSSREGYDVLRQYVETNPYDDYSWEPLPPAGQGWAITNRTLSFGGQPLFPPGIDLEKQATPGPWFDLFVYDSVNACTEGPGPSRGRNPSYLNQSGIVWFPGSAPLYKNGRLIGGLGVSGDGVEQDDFVTAEGTRGFEPPDELRVDQSVIITGAGETVRLPYWKYPRNPTQP